MRDSLDALYKKELDYFRSSCAEFAEKFPKIAARLSLGTTGIADPHVERLIQAFAYLNARTRLKLDDSFPEIVDGMLNVLYPQMLRPIPSMAIVGMSLAKAQKDLFGGYEVPAGTLLESERVQDTACRFRTCYPIRLFPAELNSAQLLPRPFSGPTSPGSARASACLRFSFSTYDPKVTFEKYGMDSIRFFLSIPNFEKAGRLLELVLTQTIEVVIVGSERSKTAAVLPASCIRPVGLQPGENLLPSCPRSFPGYALLTEYLVLPQKFLFFEITGITPAVLSKLGNALEISILLAEHQTDLEDSVSKETIRTGCTPIVNLFSRTSDAIPLNRRTSEYRLIPDARAEGSLEVYSVDRVAVDDESGESRELLPFYGIDHSLAPKDAGYWYATRRPGPTDGDSAQFRSAAEMYISVIDRKFTPWTSGRGFLFTDVTCFNRSLPEMLSHRREAIPVQFGFAGPSGPVSLPECLVAPTPVLRNHMGRGHLWPLVSQLSLNHLSLSGSDGAEALREILRLNDPKDSVQTVNLIAGIRALKSVPCTQRLGTVFVRGTEIQMMLEDENFAGDSAYLFSSVLNQFFSMYTTLNSFTKLSATTSRRNSRGLKPWTWSAQTGHRPLI